MDYKLVLTVKRKEDLWTERDHLLLVVVGYSIFILYLKIDPDCCFIPTKTFQNSMYVLVMPMTSASIGSTHSLVYVCLSISFHLG